MHRLLDWLEPRLGRFAVPNLTLALIVGQVMVYLAVQLRPQAGILERLILYRPAVLEGEAWRLVTYLFVPPGMNPLFAFFFWYLFYLMGTALEQQWGEFRYNAFLLVGWLATAGAAMLPWVQLGENLFLQATVFLAFARLYPDFTILLMFILPVKIKWLAYLQWAVYLLTLLLGESPEREMVLAAILNYLLFFGGEHVADAKAGARRRKFQAKAAPQGRLRHECAVCGRNSDDEPRVAFRYCSQCAGGRCYCPDHLRDHQHVT